MDHNQPQVAQLRAIFQSIDTENTGFITKEQFTSQANVGNKIPVYKINSAFSCQIEKDKINEENFIIFMLGVQIGMEDFAIFKFGMEKNISKYQSASPPGDIGQIKSSSANIRINKQSSHKAQQNQHSLGLTIGLSQQEQAQRSARVTEVLGRKVSDLYLLLKFKVNKNGVQIASQIEQALQMLFEMATQLGQDDKLSSLLQSLTVSSRFFQGQVYIVAELNNTFFSLISQYLNEATYTVSPKPHVMLKVQGKSNFSQLIQESFDLFKHSAQLNVNFDIDNTILAKVKEMMVDNPQFEVQSNQPLVFLLEQIRFNSSFSSIGECFETLGVSHEMIPKPSSIVPMIKENSIKELLSQFIPDADSLIDMISESEEPVGQISLNIGQILARITFNVNVEGAFEML